MFFHLEYRATGIGDDKDEMVHTGGDHIPDVVGMAEIVDMHVMARGRLTLNGVGFDGATDGAMKGAWNRKMMFCY